MNIDLDKLEQVARAATQDWKRSRAFGQLNVQDEEFMLSDADAIYAEAASPAVVLELVCRLRAAEAQADHLRAIANVLGLPDDADTATETLPAILGLTERLRAAEADAARYQWLRDPETDIAKQIEQESSPGIWEWKAGDDLDAAIDKARAAQGASHD